jgi:hypothetical protein
MDITITLDAETERFVREEAEKRGVAVETVVAQVMEGQRKAAQLAEMFQRWEKEDAANPDDDTFETIVKALNEGRKGYRQHFPAELKGKSW